MSTTTTKPCTIPEYLRFVTDLLRDDAHADDIVTYGEAMVRAAHLLAPVIGEDTDAEQRNSDDDDEDTNNVVFATRLPLSEANTHLTQILAEEADRTEIQLLWEGRALTRSDFVADGLGFFERILADEVLLKPLH